MTEFGKFTHSEQRQRDTEPKRGWACPQEEIVATYIDQTIEDRQGVRFQKHLSGCAYCRNLVADIVKLQRSADLPAAPVGLIARVRSLQTAAPVRMAWWASTTAVGCLACAVLALTLFKSPQPLRLSSWPAPSGPAISKSEPLPTPAEPPRDAIRGSGSPQQLPTVTFPAADSEVAPNRMEFHWSSVPTALYYEVRVVTAEGELVWQIDTPKNHIAAPDDLVLHSGKYFVLVSAVMENGRTRKSGARRFHIVGN